MSITTCIEVCRLKAGYEHSVLHDISFSVIRAQTTVIIGQSGSGKSTLLKTMVGLIPPLEGEIRYFDKSLASISEHERAAFYRNLGVLYQSSALLNSQNVLENISLPLRMHYPQAPLALVREMVRLRLEQVGLPNTEKLFPSQLSGGMRKRIGLARALILDPQIIYCDEPTAGLDPVTASGIDRLILKLKKELGVTFVVVTHDLDSIDRIAD